MSQKRANCSGPGKDQWGPRSNSNELPTTGDEPTKGNVARGKKFGAPGEVPFYPRGNAASKRGARTRTFPPGLRSNPKHTILNFTYL